MWYPCDSDASSSSESNLSCDLLGACRHLGHHGNCTLNPSNAGHRMSSFAIGLTVSKGCSVELQFRSIQ